MVPKDKTSSPIDSLYPNAPIHGPKKSPGRPPKKDPAKTQAEAPVATYSGRGSQTIVRKSNDLIQNAMSDRKSVRVGKECSVTCRWRWGA